MMQELQKLYADIPVPPNLKEDILTYCRTAQEKPKPIIVRYAKPLAALAACAAVLIVSLAATGHLFGGGNTNLPVGVPETSLPEPESAVDSSTPESATTTMGTMRTTTVRGATTTKGATTTTAHLEGTGGDQGSCEKHVMFYHSVDGRLIDYVGSDALKAYLKEYGIENTSHLTREEREQYNVVHFLKHFTITKEALITAMGWTDMLDEKPNTDEIGIGYYNDHYTYREMADALYSGDQALIDRVFYLEIIVVPTSTTTTTLTTETVTEPSADVSVLKPINGTTSTRGAYNPE